MVIQPPKWYKKIRGNAADSFFYGGRDGIRTHEPLTKLTVFKTASFNRSDTLP